MLIRCILEGAVARELRFYWHVRKLTSGLREKLSIVFHRMSDPKRPGGYISENWTVHEYKANVPKKRPTSRSTSRYAGNC